jgi:hypothetical protein
MKLTPIAKNQTEVTINNFTILFSYETPVAFLNIAKAGKTNQFYSQTTTKHINAFLRRYGILPEQVKQVEQAKIDQLLK